MPRKASPAKPAKPAPRAATSPVTAILREALARIKPASDDLKEAEAFVSELAKRLAAKKIKAEVMVGGSGAKGTHLAGDHDIDVFVRFDEALYRGKDRELSDLLALVLPGAERIHGSRDYFQLRRGDYLFEIVPVLKVTDPARALNVMDMSPLHVEHVRKHVRKRPGLADEIRLAKQFSKAAKVYGAESYIHGFSGHVVDLLILNYGSFTRLIEAAAKWKRPLVLDPEKHHRDPLFSLNSSKRQGPMVIVDPIQPERNAAAAVSDEAFGGFIVAVKAFLKKPSAEAFTVVPLTPGEIKERSARKYAKKTLKTGQKTVLFIIEGLPTEGKDDVVATKLRAAHERIAEEASRAGFSVLEQGWEWSKKTRKSIGYFVFKDETLPSTFERSGPPLGMEKACEAFKKEHPGAKARGDRLVAKIERKHRTPKAFIEAMLKSPYVKERAAAMKPV